MKKLINTAGIFGVLSLLSGIFYREFTKFNNFTGITVLKGTHVHFMVLGCFLFLFLILFAKNFAILEDKKFKTFYKLYVIGLPLMVSLMYIKGIYQVLGVEQSKALASSIAGVAGISHTLVAIALGYLFFSLKGAISDESK